MSNNVNAAQLLEDELIEALARETGLAPSMARYFVLPIVKHLQRQYGGSRLYIASPGRTYEVDEIAAFLHSTRDVNATCAKFNISRATLYRLIEAAKEPEERARSVG